MFLVWSCASAPQHYLMSADAPGCSALKEHRRRTEEGDAFPIPRDARFRSGCLDLAFNVNKKGGRIRVISHLEG